MSSIEEKFQKKSPIEHILLRPDTYIGSVEPNNENELSRAMINLFENIELKTKIIENQKKLSEKRNWKNIAEITKKVYDNKI